MKVAIRYLLVAEKDYFKLCILGALEHIQGFIAGVYDRLGMISERDAAAERHNATLTEMSQGHGTEVSDDMKAVWNLVEGIGVALSCRDNAVTTG